MGRDQTTSLLPVGSTPDQWPSQASKEEMLMSMQELSEPEGSGSLKVEVSAEGGGLGGMRRTKSVFSILSSVSSSSSTSTCCSESDLSASGTDIASPLSFATAITEHVDGNCDAPNFDSSLRKLMEPHLRHTRRMREKTQNRDRLDVADSIASAVGVPYTSLRHERPFLFDTHTHPLHEVLASTLQVDDLTRIHETCHDQGELNALLTPLVDSRLRARFHAAYESFVTSLCIPLLQELAISKRLFHTTSASECTIYRYQAFPTIQIHTPGDVNRQKMIAPSCDVANGHSIGCLKFHVPLTPSFGTNALYTESHPGREDWHPLQAKSVGLGFLYDGARCLHFDLENTTDATRVSLEFRILMYSSNAKRDDLRDDGVLTPLHLVEDSFSLAEPDYYDEAYIDPRTLDLVAKKVSSPRN